MITSSTTQLKPHYHNTNINRIGHHPISQDPNTNNPNFPRHLIVHDISIDNHVNAHRLSFSRAPRRQPRRLPPTASNTTPTPTITTTSTHNMLHKTNTYNHVVSHPFQHSWSQHQWLHHAPPTPVLATPAPTANHFSLASISRSQHRHSYLPPLTLEIWFSTPTTISLPVGRSTDTFSNASRFTPNIRHYSSLPPPPSLPRPLPSLARSANSFLLSILFIENRTRYSMVSGAWKIQKPQYCL